MTTLKPAVAFALTCAEIDPLVLVTVEPPAFHCQPTYVSVFAFVPRPVPTLNPFELNDVIRSVFDWSAVVSFGKRVRPVPLTASIKT